MLAPWKKSYDQSQSVQFNSVAQSCLTLCNSMDYSTPGALSVTNSWNLLKLMSIKSVMASNHIILCLLLLPSIFPSIRVFSNESGLCNRWPKYWSFSFNISPSNEYSVLISFRMDWFDVLAVQGTLKSLLQHHKSKASTLWHSAFFMVQLSHSYMKSQDVCMHAKLLQSCLTLSDPMDCSPPGPSVHGILQAWILGWVAMPSSRVSSGHWDPTCIAYFSCIGRRVLYHEHHLGSLKSQATKNSMHITDCIYFQKLSI